MADNMPMGNNSSAQLKNYIERIERLQADKKAYTDDIREVFAEANGNGFDVKAMIAVLKLRAQDTSERKHHQAIVDYSHALGIEW